MRNKESSRKRLSNKLLHYIEKGYYSKFSNQINQCSIPNYNK